MACKKCGSDWVTPTGQDCSRCPECDKLQRCLARKQGRIPAEIKKTCCVCGQSFTVSPNKHNAKHCGRDECRKQLERQKRHRYKERKELGITNTKPEERFKKICKRQGCNKQPKASKHEYCSKACAGADAREFKRGFMGRSAEMREAASFASWFVDIWEPQRPIWMQCECCGKQVERLSSMQRVCGDKCRYRLEKPLHENCCDCGLELHADTRYIKRCDACKRKRRSHWKRIAGKTPRKRCRRHGVPCDPTIKSRDVFERDRYRCQLCGRKCLAKFRVVNEMPHPLSPTVDHIIAISRGIKGHTWDNVQCACWECNVAKGASARGQLRLSLA